ncbi:2941_t:CDS:2, partial [Racocetra persica]
MKDTFYISQRAANTIIADITPYRISPEALSAINNFLDEFLYLLVDSSRSLCLENIKPAIFNVLPTNLGKNSIKEAEFELKTFMESGNFDKTLEKNVEIFEPYPVQKIFEQFRIKCKYYSTLSEQSFSINDRDPSTVPGLHNSEGIYISPSLAIYMTAVLEYVGEHILILVAKALKQQGDATVAKANDETLSIQPQTPDSNITLSPLSPKTPSSENATEDILLSNPTKGGDNMFRSPEVVSSSSLTKGDNNAMFQSPEAISPSSPTKSGDIMSRSPEVISPGSPIKQGFHNEVGIGSRKTSIDDVVWSKSPTSPNRTINDNSYGRISLESKNSGTNSEKNKFKDRDIKSISSLDDIDKMISFEHLISTNQNLTLKVSLTSNRMKTIETQKQEPRKFEPREPKKPKESLFEFLKNTDPDDIFIKSTGKLRRKDSKVDLLQKRLFNNKSGSVPDRASPSPTNSVRPRHIPLIPSGRLSASNITIPPNHTKTLHHSKSLDQLNFDEDDYDIINYEKPPRRFDTQDLIDFLNTSSPPNDTFAEKKKEKKFTKLLSKLRIPSKNKYENGTRLSNTDIVSNDINNSDIVSNDINNSNIVSNDITNNLAIINDINVISTTNNISDAANTEILLPQDDKIKHDDDDVKKSEQYGQQIIKIIVDNFLQEIIFMESVFEESDNESEQKLTSEVTEDEMGDV